nr:MAG TPA: NADH-PPase NADH pyrophosphatase zinc ribbon domain [Caudoviricetes sp.]
MDEYISREAAMEIVKHTSGDYASAFAELRKLPAADVAPVRHGRWVTHYRSGTTVAEGYVSTCCDMWNNRKSDFCPNCGARMDGAE